MRTLTETLEAAQKFNTRTPYVGVVASNNTSAGAINLQFTRLYSGAELDGCHAVTMPGDGSLIRLRVTSLADNRKLYRQRVTSPGSGSTYSSWTYLNQYSITAVAACSLAAEVSIFYARYSTGLITRVKSTDNGATWTTTDYPGYAPSGTATQLSAAYKPNGDLALFIVDSNQLYVIKRVSGAWQYREMWDKTTGILTGVAVTYDGDWKLLVSGEDSSGNNKVWSLVYGDGGEVAAGSWSTSLKTIMTAPSDGLYNYQGLFLDKSDVIRGSFSEVFTGVEAHELPFLTHALPGTAHFDSRWREPGAFDLDTMNCANGLAMCHSSTYAWLTTPFGVWRAALAPVTLDLSADVLVVKADLAEDGGALEVELLNNGKYSTLPEVLKPGYQISLSPGCRTSAGNEISDGLIFTLQGYEYYHSPGKARVILTAADGWDELARWVARYQFIWNQPDSYGDPVQEASTWEILAQVLARAGLRMDVVSCSAVVANFYPYFTIHPGDDGKSIIKKLLSYVPDVLYIEGATAYLYNPQAVDQSTYNYGEGHDIIEGHYGSGAWKLNRIRVDGQSIDYNTGIITPVTNESYAWDEISRSADRLLLIEDKNVNTAAGALARGEAYLRQAEIEAYSGFIRVPVNCGQQLYDVIEITDALGGQGAVNWRVLGIKLAYERASAGYMQKLVLGGV